MSSLKYFGIPIVSIGLANPKDEPTLKSQLKRIPRTMCTRKSFLRNNVIVGMTLVNCIERAGILFHLMKNQLTSRNLNEICSRDDFGLAILPVGLQRKLSVVQ